MKICWDNLEKIRYDPKTGTFRNNGCIYYEYTLCLECNDPYLGLKNSEYCSCSCSNTGKNNGFYGKYHTKEVKKKFSVIAFKRSRNPMYGKKHTEKTKQLMKDNHADVSGDKNPMFGIIRLEEQSTNWKGGVKKNNIPLYDTFSPQLEPIEQCRRNVDDPNILEVKCTYCGKWHVPNRRDVDNRIQFGINKNDTHRFYCSDGCKQECPVYGKSAEQLIRRDVIAAGHILPNELNREVQPQLRQMTLERDEYLCVKCGSDCPLHCHHIDPVAINPIESADIDNCITLCIECHNQVHRIPGCGYGELKECNEWIKKF